jgi:nucleotide-binding universal stress UspA family protein
MAIKDVLLALTTYPVATPLEATNHAVAIAKAIDARLSGIAMEAQLQVPGRFQFFSDALLDIPGLAAGEAQKSAEHANALVGAFEAAAGKHNVLRESLRERAPVVGIPGRLAARARYYDLTICPVQNGQTDIATALIFESGRPVLLTPAAKASETFALNTCVIAWDSSRPAARAVADALPLLEKAETVRIVAVLHDKEFDARRATQELAKSLSHHGISAAADVVDLGNRGIGDVLQAYAATHSADLVVMGAFGHSRLREFVLGGATAHMLNHMPTPILMSH